MWQDEIKHENGRMIYESRGRKPEGRKSPGRSERLDNLKWARDHCGGRVRVVIAIAEDVKAVPRRAIEWFPQDSLIMEIRELDEETGAFRAVQVDSMDTAS
jgi:hypothetical protein